MDLATTNPYLSDIKEAEAEGKYPIAEAIPMSVPQVAPMKSEPIKGNPYLADAQGIPTQHKPEGRGEMSPLDTFYQVVGMTTDYLKGAAHGILEDIGGNAEMIAKVAPYLPSPMGPGMNVALRADAGAHLANAFPAGGVPPVPGALEHMAGMVKEGTQAIDPLPEGPASPEEHLGYDTRLIHEMLAGGGVAKAGVHASQYMPINAIVKKLLKGGDQLEEVPEQMRALVRPEGLPRGITEEVSKKMLDDVRNAPEAVNRTFLDPLMNTMTKGHLDSYRTKAIQLFDSERGYLIPDTLKKRLLGWEGMTAKEFMNYRYLVSNRAKAPTSKFAEETPEARGRRGAYSELLNAMDTHFKDTVPADSVLRQYSTGLKMYKVVKNWQEAKRIFAKGLDRDAKLDRVFNYKKVRKELDRMTPKRIREIFGTDVWKAELALRKAAGQTVKAKEKAKRGAQLTFMKYATASGLGAAVGNGLLGRMGPVQTSIREAVGGQGGGHQGMGR